MSHEPQRATRRVVTDIMRCLVRVDVDGADTLLARSDIDTANIYTLLEKSRLAGYFHTLVSDSTLTRFFSAVELEGLAASHRHQVAKCETNIALLSMVGERLDEASIPFLTIKGLYLAQRFFGDVQRRFMWDVDILVHSDDLNTAIAAVAPLGLLAHSVFKVELRNPFWGIHAVEVRGPVGKLDIHHAIRVLPKISFDYDRMWSRSREFTVGIANFATLSDTDHLLTTAVGLAADVQTGHHNLRKIWDMYMMLRLLDTGTDWDAFMAERRTEGSLKLVLNMFTFCLLLLGAEEDCPRLNQTIAAHRRLLLVNCEQQAARIFGRGRQHIANRVLFSRLLPVSPLWYWSRWLLTLPVRLWHYRRTQARKPRR